MRNEKKMKPQKIEKKTLKFADKNTSPSHQRTISLSDIRLARLTTVSDQQINDSTLQGAASVVAAATAASLNGTNTSGADNIITIKQESITNVDNLVGSYVDSTTFLPSPNINANLIQTTISSNDAQNDGK